MTKNTNLNRANELHFEFLKVVNRIESTCAETDKARASWIAARAKLTIGEGIWHVEAMKTNLSLIVARKVRWPGVYRDDYVADVQYMYESQGDCGGY